MKIRWANIVSLVLFITALVLFVRCRREIVLFVSNIINIGPNHNMDEQTLGLIALGIIGVCIVAIVRIVTRN